MANLVSYAFSIRQLKLLEMLCRFKRQGAHHSESLDLAYNKSFQGQNAKCNTMHLPFSSIRSAHRYCHTHTNQESGTGIPPTDPLALYSVHVVDLGRSYVADGLVTSPFGNNMPVLVSISADPPSAPYGKYFHL